MSSKESKTREEVVAAREAKKLAKQKVKSKDPRLTLEMVKSIVKERTKSTSGTSKDDKPAKERTKSTSETSKDDKPAKERTKSQSEAAVQKSKDEVDKAAAIPIDIKEIETVQAKTGPVEKDKDQIQADRAGKKAAKQAQIKGRSVEYVPASSDKYRDMTVKDVGVTLEDIKEVYSECKDIKAKVEAFNLKGRKNSDEEQVFNLFY